MDRATLTRWRWRLRGAWMWPSFVALTVVDGAIASWLPVFDDRPINALVGWLYSFIWTLIAVVVLGAPLGWLVRRVRGDMPKVVARDYAGAFVCLTVTATFLVVGVADRPAARAQANALQDATGQAEQYIGEHAPQQFMSNLRRLDTYPLQPPWIYRTCVTNTAGTRDYCVVVNRSEPFGRNVKYAGSEPNGMLSEGTS